MLTTQLLPRRKPVYSTRTDKRPRNIQVYSPGIECIVKVVCYHEIQEARRRIELRYFAGRRHYIYHPSNEYKKFISNYFKKLLK